MSRNVKPRVLVDVLNLYLTNKSPINAREMAALLKQVMVSVFDKFGISQTDFASQVVGEIVRASMNKQTGISRKGERDVLQALKEEIKKTPNAPDIFRVSDTNLPPDAKGVYNKYISPFLKSELSRFVASPKNPSDYRRLSQATDIIKRELTTVVKNLKRYTGNDFASEYVPANRLLRESQTRLILDNIVEKELKNSRIGQFVSNDEFKKFLQSAEAGVNGPRFNMFVVDLIQGLEKVERQLTENGMNREGIKKILKFSNSKNLESVYNMVIPLYDKLTPGKRERLKEIISNLTLKEWLVGATVTAATAGLAKYVYDNSPESMKQLLQLLQENEVAPRNTSKDRQMFEPDPVDPEDEKDRTVYENDPPPDPQPEQPPAPAPDGKTPNVANKDETIQKLTALFGNSQTSKRSFAQPVNYNIPSIGEYVPTRRQNVFNQSIGKGIKTGKFQR